MSSKEDEIIELVELTSPVKEKSKKSNKINSVNLDIETYSISSVSEEANILNIFSVTPRQKLSNFKSGNEDTCTNSEISDDVFNVRPESSVSQVKSYKEKISEHIKKIKEKASTSSQDMLKSRSKIQLDRIRRETENSNAEIESVRKKFNLNAVSSFQQDLDNFLYFKNDVKDSNSKSSEDCVHYVPPDNLRFNVSLAEKECFFRPSRRNIAQNKSFDASVQRSATELNFLKQRLLINDEDHLKWLDSESQIVFCKNPVTYSLPRQNFETDTEHLYRYVSGLYHGEECEEVIVDEDKILNFTLYQLVFLHHPLFSLEHVFAAKLKLDYKEFENIRNNKILETLRSKLDELRTKRGNISKAKKEVMAKIKDVREQYILECQKYRDTIKCILETWKMIKKIRETQKYSNTNLRLLIQKEATDYGADLKEFDKFLEETSKELTYEILLDDDKNKIEEQVENDDSGDSVKSNRTFTVDKENDSINKDVEKETQNLLKMVKKCLRPPGEPILNFVLTESNEITITPENSGEINRRNNLENTKICFRILCNNIEVCKTKCLNLNNEFIIEVNETFSLKLIEVPKHLTVEIMTTTKSLQKKRIIELNIPISNCDSKTKFGREYFEKNDVFHYKHDGIGSGVDLKTAATKHGIKILNKNNTYLKTNGFLEYSIEWEKKTQRCYNEDNDLKFVEKFELLTEENENANYFTLDLYSKDLTFCNITEIDKNIRLQLLRLRNQNEIEFEGVQIPNRIKEIPLNILSDYKLRKNREMVSDIEDDGIGVEAGRSFGKKYLKQVYIRAFQICKNMQNNLDYDSVINESVFIYFHVMVKTLIRNFFNWFRWRPKISKPLPILERKSNEKDSSKLVDNVCITIQIISAKNIPNRLKNEGDESINVVKPFVKVIYRNMSFCTEISSGINPVWNESVTIKLDATQTDYLNPNAFDGNIFLHLYDQKDSTSKRLNNDKYNNWLGSLELSLASICSNRQINGFFKIKLPYVLMGYEMEGEKQTKKSLKITNSRSFNTYLNLEICIEPHIPYISPSVEEFPVGDVPYIHDHIIKWNNLYNASFPSRKFSALAIDINMKTKCITRYLSPLEPPQLNSEEFNVTAEQCLKFVSLIPFTDFNQFYNNIWLSPEQFIRLSIGSIVDHAVLLTCYLLALKLDVWLLLGYGITYGSTAYVLVREYASDTGLPYYYIYDSFYGEKYGLLDEFCPLQSIYCVANSENVWGNIQRSDISLTRFDFTKRADWWPLFNDRVSPPTNFIINKVDYKSKCDSEGLEKYMEKQIKKQISKLRQLNRTTWNSNVSKMLHSALKFFELATMYTKDFESLGELNKFMSTHEINGFVINEPFLSVTHIVKKIKSLEFHVQEDDTEYGIAVHIQTYPSQVLSVWIFLVNIKVKDFEIESVL